MPKNERRPMVVNLYNAIGGVFSGTRMDADKLIAKARSRSKLHHLGDDFNDEALLQLLKSVNAEARLNPFGQMMLSEKLITQLENRLWAEYWFKQHPEILEAEVLPIVLVSGLQRTGTTKMQRLLSQSYGARALYSWEAMYPAPIGSSNEFVKRKGYTRRNEKAVKWISPQFQAIHPIDHSAPEEDVLLLDHAFMSSTMEAILHVPSYSAWLEKQNQQEAYSYEHKLLRLLQWQKGGDYWVLKSPHHMEFMDDFEAVYPNSKLIWMHRHPEECIPSFMSMLYYSRRMFSDAVDPEVVKSDWLPKLRNMLEGGMKYRSTHPEKILDVAYTELLGAEDAVQARVKEHALPNGAAAWPVRKAERAYRSTHRYSLEDWNMSSAELEKQFDIYFNWYNKEFNTPYTQ